MAAAAAVCVERGYEGATVGEIARRAGVTTGAIYNHFGGRSELLVEAGRQTLAVVSGDAPPERRHGAVRRFLAAELRRHPPVPPRAAQRLDAPRRPRPLLGAGTPSGPASWRPAASTASTSRRCSSLLLGCCQLEALSTTRRLASAESRRPCRAVGALGLAGCGHERRHGVDFSLPVGLVPGRPVVDVRRAARACPLHHTTSRRRTTRCRSRPMCGRCCATTRRGRRRFGPGLSYADPDRARRRARVERPAAAHRRAAGDLPPVQAVGDRGDGARHRTTGRHHRSTASAPAAEGDLIADLAMPVPLTVMCWMLGTPVADIDVPSRGSCRWPRASAVPDGRLLPYVADAYRNFIAYFGATSPAARPPSRPATTCPTTS